MWPEPRRRVVSSSPHVLSSAVCVRSRGAKGFQSSGNSLRFEHGGLRIFPRVRLEQETKLIQNNDKAAYQMGLHAAGLSLLQIHFGLSADKQNP